jgi:hypothetical protein
MNGRDMVARGLFPRYRERTKHVRTVRSAWALIALFLLLLLWVWLAIDAVAANPVPNGSAFGVDFSHTYAAVRVLSSGHNPYDYHRLSHAQHALLSQAGLPVQSQSPVMLVGTSTFYLWVLQPINAFPFQVVAIAWMLSTYVLVGFVFLALLRHFGWRRRGLPTIIFLVTPPVALGIFYGNMISLTFAGIAGAFPLLRRYPILAGVILSVSVLKLPVALPLVGLIVLFHAPHKRRVVAGFLTAFLALHLLATVLLGPEYQRWWLQSLVNFSDTMQLQPNLTSLSGLYAYSLPHTPRLVLEIASIAFAGALTLAFWWKYRSSGTVPLQQTGWLWFVWMLATPYAHYIDEIVLVIPVIALLGRDGRYITRPLTVLVLYLLGLSILLFSWTPMHVQLLWVPLVLCAGCFGLVAYRYPAEQAEHVAYRHALGDVPAASSGVPVLAQ